MSSQALTDWIDAQLDSDPPRAKSLVMTVFGDAIAPHGGAAWLGSLIALLAPLQVNDRLLRTSVYRLVQEGWLSARREGRRSQYAIDPAALPRFARANARIYLPGPSAWDGQWTLVLAASEALKPGERAELREELGWLGFAQVGTGLLAHPCADPEALAGLLARLDAGPSVHVLRAADLPGVTARQSRDWIENGWDLSDVKLGYEHFLEQFGQLDRLCEHASISAAQAYAVRVLLIHAYRRVQLQDPMLPLELLPGTWPGPLAYALAARVYRRLHASADRFIVQALAKEADQVPPCDAAYYERFGGLMPVTQGADAVLRRQA